MKKKRYLGVFLALAVLFTVFTGVTSAQGDVASADEENAVVSDTAVDTETDTVEDTATDAETDTAVDDTATGEEASTETEEATEEHPITVKSADYNKETGDITVTIANTTTDNYALVAYLFDEAYQLTQIPTVVIDIALPAGKSYTITASYEAGLEANPVIGIMGQYAKVSSTEGGFPGVDVYNQMIVNLGNSYVNYNDIVDFEYTDVLRDESITPGQAVLNFLNQTGFVRLFTSDWKSLVMILIACVLFFLAIVKGFEPLLLLPIAFGMLLTNLPGADMFHEALWAGGHAHWNLFDAHEAIAPGLLDYLYLGVKLGIYPCLIFFGVGAMTDFEPLIANPKSLLLGAAAQLGIFVTFFGARMLGFDVFEASSIGIIGGADGPTAIYVASRLAPHLLGPIAVAAYSYMALVPVIQPPIMKLLTTKKERSIKMQALRKVSKTEKIIFPIVVTIFVALLVPSAAPLVGALMLGNLFKESGVTERLSKTVQNELMNIVTIFLGVSVGATATAETFLSLQTIKIIVMGVVAFAMGTAGGLLLAKFMNLFLKNKINPLIGSAGVSAVPMAARVSQVVGQKENPSNFLLMHAMGPNVAGVIGSAIAAGVLIALFG